MRIGLAAGMSAVKMAATKSLILETVKIDRDGMYMEMNLIKQNIKVLL